MDLLGAWLANSPSAAEALGVFALIAFLGITMVIGLIHEARIIAEWLIVLIEHVKKEIIEARVVYRRLVSVLTKWDVQ